MQHLRHKDRCAPQVQAESTALFSSSLRNMNIHSGLCDSVFDALHPLKLNRLCDVLLRSRSRQKKIHLLCDSVFETVHRNWLNRLHEFVLRPKHSTSLEDLHRHFRLGDLLHKLQHTLPGDHFEAMEMSSRTPQTTLGTPDAILKKDIGSTGSKPAAELHKINQTSTLLESFCT